MIQIKTYIKEIDTFLENLFEEVESYNGNIHISTNNYVLYNNDKCNGLFAFDTESNPYIAFNIGRPIDEWFPVLVHESCHFDQWKDNNRLWKDLYINGIDLCDELFDWVNGKDNLIIPIEEIHKRVKAIELDCEERTLEKIEKSNLPIDKEIYTTKSNAYIQFYDYVLKKRKWYTIGKEPYNNKEVLKQMSKKDLNQCHQPLRPEVEKLFNTLG